MQVFTLLSPYGWLAGAWSGQGLKALVLPHGKMEEALAKLALLIKVNPFSLPAPSPVRGAAQKFANEIKRYFRGEEVCFSAIIDWSGYTPFQRRVLEIVKTIPYGEVRSYGQVARAAGSPRGARAVGGVMRANRTPLVIPCHRVVASDGSLGGFSDGLEMKKHLLSLEKAKNYNFYNRLTFQF